MTSDVQRCLKEDVRRKLLDKWWSLDQLLHHDNTLAHMAHGFVCLFVFNQKQNGSGTPPPPPSTQPSPLRLLPVPQDENPVKMTEILGYCVD
jgi:hypothetical protein